MSIDDSDGPHDPRPALRASDVDRDRVVDLLRRAAGEGRIDLDELDERVSAAYATRTLIELEALTHDLVPATADAAAATTPVDGVVVRAEPGGTRRIVAILGGHERRGRWRVATRCVVVSVMGGADLDLTDAELSGQSTRVRVISIMGGAGLRLPSGVDVQVSRFALMGGHDVKLDPDAPPPGAPVIHLTLLSLMGGTEVRQGPRRAAARHDWPSMRERGR